MQCGIVTVYNSENCGSFLQAYALAKTLQKQGHNVAFIRQNFGDHSASRRNYLKMLAKTILRGNFQAIKHLTDKRKDFHDAIGKQLLIIKDGKDVDCCILGSDVIWDVTVPFFKRHHSFFWGTQFGKTKVVSYAASLGFAKKEDLDQQKFVRDALGSMSAVSVRDKISKRLLQPYCDKEIQIVCDPTYLINRADYDAIAKPTDIKDFLFIYYYGKMPSDYIEEIRGFAQKQGLKTVTFGHANPWCDISFAYDPLLFLSLYDAADFIITNTFHGTVFATIYQKRFAVIRNEKPKIHDVLDMCAMSDKMTETPEDISRILTSDFHYDVTHQLILRERENGHQYLKNALEGCIRNG